MGKSSRDPMVMVAKIREALSRVPEPSHGSFITLDGAGTRGGVIFEIEEAVSDYEKAQPQIIPRVRS